MLNQIKLKHLDKIASKDIDYMYLMKDVLGYKDSWWTRKTSFKKQFNKLYSTIGFINKLNPKLLVQNPKSPIKSPDNIDSISFAAMMELKELEETDFEIGYLMTEFITLICYSSNVKKPFDKDSFEYKVFKSRVENMPVIDAIGLYNHLDKKMIESNLVWETMFLQVQFDDSDYIEAGGDSLQAFNVINSIKGITNDFNVSYKEAWNLSYGVVQANSLAKATAAKVQERMTKIKENRMKTKRGIR